MRCGICKNGAGMQVRQPASRPAAASKPSTVSKASFQLHSGHTSSLLLPACQLHACAAPLLPPPASYLQVVVLRLHVAEVDELRLRDGLVRLAEHALLEQQLGLVPLLQGQSQSEGRKDNRISLMISAACPTRQPHFIFHHHYDRYRRARLRPVHPAARTTAPSPRATACCCGTRT